MIFRVAENKTDLEFLCWHHKKGFRVSLKISDAAAYLSLGGAQSVARQHNAKAENKRGRKWTVQAEGEIRRTERQDQFPEE